MFHFLCTPPISQVQRPCSQILQIPLRVSIRVAGRRVQRVKIREDRPGVRRRGKANAADPDGRERLKYTEMIRFAAQAEDTKAPAQAAAASVRQLQKIYRRMTKIANFSISTKTSRNGAGVGKRRVHRDGFGLVSVNKALVLRSERPLIERKALSISV